MRFYVGLHQPSDAHHFTHCCLSVNRLRRRAHPLGSCRVLLDSGAFTEIATHGRYRHSVTQYAADIRRLAPLLALESAVAQDYMCEPCIVQRTGLSVAEHQQLTIARYVALREVLGDTPYLMPVLQGYHPQEYVRHLRDYGRLVPEGAWVGVGSVCKRNSTPEAVVAVLEAIAAQRPDLQLHGFGVKITALLHPGVRALLHSADSMAWSYHARMHGRNGNDWREAQAFAQRVEQIAAQPPEPWQLALFPQEVA